MRGVVLAFSLTVLAASCQLLEPSPTGATRVDGSADLGGVAVSPVDQEPRESLKADDVVDSVATIGGAVTGNPALWALAGTLGHLVVGAFSRRKTA